MKQRPDDLIYGVDDRPPFIRLCLLGLQHALLISIYLIIISIIIDKSGAPAAVANNSMRMGLLALAFSTLIQAIRKGPVGSGYLAAPVVSAIYIDPSLQAVSIGGIGLVFGMTIFAGFVEAGLSRFLHRLRAIFPPSVCGFVVAIVGLKLGLIGIERFLSINSIPYAGFPIHYLVAATTLAIIVIFSIWMKGIARLMCSAIGAVVGFALAYFLGIIPPFQLAELSHTAWFGLPSLSFISYKFNPELILPFTVAAIAAALRSTGVITTCEKINDANWKRPSIKAIKGGVLADGIGCAVAGLVGSTGISTSPSLVGISKASGATSRAIAYTTSAILAIGIFIPKMTQLILILPMAVIGPILVFTGSFMIVGGIQVITSRNIGIRSTLVIGISLLLGLSHEIFPHFYTTLPTVARYLSESMLTLSVLSAIFLNLIFRIGIRRHSSVTIDQRIFNPEQLEGYIQIACKTWGVPQEIIDRACSSTKEFLSHLYSTHLCESDIIANVDYDDIDLRISIHYQGDLLSLPFAGKKRVSYLEEEAFSYGLAEFWNGVFPDEISYKQKQPNVSITLKFNV